MDTLLLIDGNAIMHRAYHALPPFKTKSGIPTNVIYGFFTMLYKAVTDFKPNQIIVCFDTPAPTFRNKLYKEYQAQRPKISDEFITQIPIVKEALNKAGILHLEKEGLEADDLIGTVAKKSENKGARVLILTGDKDILQLVDRNIFVMAPQLGLSNIKMYDENEVKKKFALPPNLIPDLKALMGDPSDNYPGAKGIGPKTAAKLLQKYHSIDNLYRHLDQLDDKTKKILEENRKNVLMSHKLATIKTDVEIEIDINKSKFENFDPKLKVFFEEYEMKSLVGRIFNNKSKEQKVKEAKKPKTTKEQMGLF